MAALSQSLHSGPQLEKNYHRPRQFAWMSVALLQNHLSYCFARANVNNSHSRDCTSNRGDTWTRRTGLAGRAHHLRGSPYFVRPAIARGGLQSKPPLPRGWGPTGALRLRPPQEISFFTPVVGPPYPPRCSERALPIGAHNSGIIIIRSERLCIQRRRVPDGRSATQLSRPL